MMDKDVKYWYDLAVYDKGTAEAMYKAGRYLYVLFMCQQATEKMLKGFVVQETNEFPPRTHDLERLAKLCKIKLEKAQLELLRVLTGYYIETRYPEDIKKISIETDKSKAFQYLKETKEFLRWLKTKFN
jgi:HEPN domain-containing protein